MIQREKLVCMLVGFYTGKNPSIDATNLRISIDQHLLNCNELSLGKDDNDLLQELLDETIISVLSGGINRQIRRATIQKIRTGKEN